MIYGYIRVSTDLQNCENQKFEIENYCKNNNLKINKYIKETISSRKKLKDRQLNNILKKIKDGDVLITTELSRLGRSILEIMEIIKLCLERNCLIITLKENYKLGNDIQSKILAFAFGMCAEIERQLISQRTKESLKRLKNEGKKLGRPLGSYSNKTKKITELLSLGMNKTEIAKKFNCCYSSVYRIAMRNY